MISDIGAASEIIPGSSRPPAQMATGWRVPPGNAEALASAIEEAYHGGRQRASLWRIMRANMFIKISRLKKCNDQLLMFIEVS